jgi:hypothetical protein
VHSTAAAASQRGLSQDHHTYVHFLNDEGQTIAQSDQRPGQEYYPSSLWTPGETLLDAHVLSIPGGTESGALTLVAGAYEYPSLAPLGSAITFGQVRVPG